MVRPQAYFTKDPCLNPDKGHDETNFNYDFECLIKRVLGSFRQIHPKKISLIFQLNSDDDDKHQPKEQAITVPTEKKLQR